ncbi:hypothetical protein BV898_04441 [Hypsibius exemplaris]|uniref:Uncharacterized protein n=1 Tax=Hypsibius exemplaris TaxID=2072580 RepID=A0A1W0X230_HYPEX|nr:hypothetical protein BV898_04441 [Hypsibius exemplaris]
MDTVLQLNSPPQPFHSAIEICSSSRTDQSDEFLWETIFSNLHVVRDTLLGLKNGPAEAGASDVTSDRATPQNETKTCNCSDEIHRLLMRTVQLEEEKRSAASEIIRLKAELTQLRSILTDLEAASEAKISHLQSQLQQRMSHLDTAQEDLEASPRQRATPHHRSTLPAEEEDVVGLLDVTVPPTDVVDDWPKKCISTDVDWDLEQQVARPDSREVSLHQIQNVEDSVKRLMDRSMMTTDESNAQLVTGPTSREVSLHQIQNVEDSVKRLMDRSMMTTDESNAQLVTGSDSREVDSPRVDGGISETTTQCTMDRNMTTDDVCEPAVMVVLRRDTVEIAVQCQRDRDALTKKLAQKDREWTDRLRSESDQRDQDNARLFAAKDREIRRLHGVVEHNSELIDLVASLRLELENRSGSADLNEVSAKLKEQSVAKPRPIYSRVLSASQNSNLECLENEPDVELETTGILANLSRRSSVSRAGSFKYKDLTPKRLAELQRRNSIQLPHLQSSYPVEQSARAWRHDSPEQVALDQSVTDFVKPAEKDGKKEGFLKKIQSSMQKSKKPGKTDGNKENIAQQPVAFTVDITPPDKKKKKKAPKPKR